MPVASMGTRIRPCGTRAERLPYRLLACIIALW
jgi:hypothetical protein